jgi:hypothetical protein
LSPRRWAFDRRGNTAFKRHPDGTEVAEQVTVRERVIRKGQEVIESRPAQRWWTTTA